MIDMLVNLVGKVVDGETGEPIPGVTIEKLLFSKPTGLYTKTDAAGLFNIPITGYNGVAFTHVSYQPETYIDGQLKAGTNTITMVRKVGVLPGVIVTAPKKGSYWVWVALAAAVGYYGYKKKWFK